MSDKVFWFVWTVFMVVCTAPFWIWASKEWFHLLQIAVEYVP